MQKKCDLKKNNRIKNNLTHTLKTLIATVKGYQTPDLRKI